MESVYSRRKLGIFMVTWMKAGTRNERALLQVACDGGSALNHCSEHEFHQDT